MVPWVVNSTVGVRGGVIARTNTIDVTQPPYNADNTGAHSAASAILSAINAATNGQVVYCPAGTYDITAGITIQHVNNITLRGAGSNTVLVGSISVGIEESTGNYPLGYGLSIASGATKGSTNMTFVSTADPVGGFSVAVGDSFEISAIFTGNDMWQYIATEGGEQRQQQTYALKQPVLITSLSGNSCSFTPPLVWNFTNSPLALPLSYIGDSFFQASSNLGFENFTLTESNGAIRSSVSPMLQLQMLHDSWVTNCNFYEAENYSVFMQQCLHCAFAHNNVRFAQSSGSNHGGLLVSDDSGCLFEDNVFADGLEPGMEWDFGFAGNAVFGNFFTNNPFDDDIDMHGTHPVMNLFEENVSQRFELDGYFGSCSHETLFRNQVENSVLLKRFSTYIAAVGNVLGSPGVNSVYTVTNSNYGTNAIFEIGYPDLGNPSFQADAGPVPYNFPGNFVDSESGLNVTNGIFVITNTAVNTNFIVGNFSNIPTTNPANGNPLNEGQYVLVGQDASNTNFYWFIGSPTNAGVTASNVTFTTKVTPGGVTVSNGWRIYVANQDTYQWLQTSNVLTDIITGNAVCTNQSSFVTEWDNNGVQSLPVSYLYTSGKPGYWGTNNWPAIGPDVSPQAGLIPAEERYLGLAAGSGGGGGSGGAGGSGWPPGPGQMNVIHATLPTSL